MSYTTTFKQVKDKYGENMLIEVRTPTGKITLKERQANHKRRHPNDKNQRKTKGIFLGKRGYKDDMLDEFYETHVHTFIDADLNMGWIKIGGEEE
tara:strand:- start:598 stop:882 length:285 start_codon:yes stop_codon:yes gene_type:complete